MLLKPLAPLVQLLRMPGAALCVCVRKPKTGSVHRKDQAEAVAAAHVVASHAGWCLMLCLLPHAGARYRYLGQCRLP